jgi:NAD(P)-dependent dehydrogenase (short-subunit alcohol dehydrogenase family)
MGRGVARALAVEGASVALLGRTKSKCDAVAVELEALGARALSLACDTGNRADVDAAIAATVESFGRVDVLVNSAQTTVYGSVRKISEDNMAAMWESGPMGCLRTMQACFDQLRATRGSVINMGSGSSILPAPAMAGYAMAKEAIRVLTRVAALEWGKMGIRVNAICPVAETPGWDDFAIKNPGADEVVLAQIPLGRMGDPETDVGSAVVFLASDEASYITGTTLMVDGGFNYLR